MIGPGGNARSPLAKVIRSQRFDRVGRKRLRGFEVTDEEEAVMTLAAELDILRLETLVDSLLARKTRSVDQLAFVATENGGARGVAGLRPIVAPDLPTPISPRRPNWSACSTASSTIPGCPRTRGRCP